MSFDEIKNKTIEENDLYEGLEIKEIERKAKEFYRSKEYSKALIGYNKLISLDDCNYKFYNRRGNAKDALGRYEEAIEDYSKAIELNPKGSVLYGNRWNSKYKAKKYKEAIEDYNKAIELDKDNYRFYNYKGRAKKN